MSRRNGNADDPAEAVGRVLSAKRDALLRAHRHRLAREDLEDCLSRAALELVGRARREALHGDRHIANALEQKSISRISDRTRMRTDRGIPVPTVRPTARLWSADPADPSPVDQEDPDDLSETLALRENLARIREVAAELTEDQRLVLACQVSLGMGAGEFCERFGWSAEKFRKVAQRARASLRRLMVEYELGERCARLEDDLVAYASGTGAGHRELIARRHVANCRGCAAFVRDLRLASARVARHPAGPRRRRARRRRERRGRVEARPAVARRVGPARRRRSDGLGLRGTRECRPHPRRALVEGFGS
jgi:DNA-directed RNA polymerase specialized sigma24 family protein